MDSSPRGLRGTVGYKYITTAGSNVDITLTRLSVEMLATCAFAQDLWAGAGAVHHTNV